LVFSNGFQLSYCTGA